MLNKRELQQQEFERKSREQAEFEAKMQKLARSMDHLERARREEEAPLLEAGMHVSSLTLSHLQRRDMITRHQFALHLIADSTVIPNYLSLNPSSHTSWHARELSHLVCRDAQIALYRATTLFFLKIRNL